MFFWRTLYLGLFALGAILMLLSAFSQHQHYLLWALIAWAMSATLWFIVKKLYADFTMPTSTQQKRRKTELPIDDIIDIFTD